MTSRTGLVRHLAVTAAAVTTLGLTFAAGVLVGQHTTDPVAEPGGTETPPLRFVNADLRAPSSCGDLLDWYVKRGLEQVTPWGWGGGMDYVMERDVSGAVPMPTASGRDSVVEQQNSATGTNVQEAGVDEPDVVKTNGSLLIRVKDRDLLVYDVTGTTPELTATLKLTDLSDAQLLLAGTTAVVLGTDTDATRDEATYSSGWWGNPGTRVLTVDLTNPAAPEVTSTQTYDAGLLGARQHGDVVRLTLTSPLPLLDFVSPGENLGEKSALEKNRALVKNSTLADWLPQRTTYDAAGTGTTQALLDCGAVALPAEDGGLGTLSIVGFDAQDPADLQASAVATNTAVAYESADRLVLATSAWTWGCWGCRMAPDTNGTTHLYSFALDGTKATYVASGSVDGAIADRWAMDEAHGILRVAVGPTSETGNFNSVVLLKENGDGLLETGRVDKLGVDEQIKSVRWFDDLAIVVTFRQTDPLYAIDLSDPAAPENLGLLKIPGFSQYLHPIRGGRLIGMGQDADAKTGATNGAQAALFNVRDLTHPKRVSLITYANQTQALAGSDPRQFTWLPDQRTALTVISKGWEGQTGWLSVLSLKHGELTNKMVEVDYGSDVYQVRTVPLPDGRVLLVTGDAVRFFDI